MQQEHYLLRLDTIVPEDIQRAAIKYLPKDRDGKYALLIRDPLKK